MNRSTRQVLTYNRGQRTAATAVEIAIVLPLVLLLMIGLCVAELGAFRYQQIAALAQESARWASVHGEEYARQSKTSIASDQDIFENVIKPNAQGLDLKKLYYNVAWDLEQNLVTVRIVYTWTPEAFFAPQQMTCTAISFATY
jgi:Flp pilus assembly protein TadG